MLENYSIPDEACDGRCFIQYSLYKIYCNIKANKKTIKSQKKYRNSI